MYQTRYCGGIDSSATKLQASRANAQQRVDYEREQKTWGIGVRRDERENRKTLTAQLLQTLVGEIL